MLSVLVNAIPIEAARAIAPDTGAEPEIFKTYRELLPLDVEFSTLPRFPFYDAARSPDITLVIATGDQRTYACILLTIGVVVDGGN